MNFKLFDSAVALLNFVVLSFLSYRMTKANERLTDMQKHIIDNQQPKFKFFIRNVSDRQKELTIINAGGGILFITYLSIRIGSNGNVYLTPPSGSGISNFDQSSACNFSLKPGQMLKFDFGSDVYSGMYGGDVIVHNLKNESTVIYFNSSTFGPYESQNPDFFYI